MRHRHELTDAQWLRIEPLLPGKVGDAGRTAVDNRLFVNAVLYVLKTGIPWADLPGRFGKPNTVWKRYGRWCAAGVWERVGRTLGDAELTGEHDQTPAAWRKKQDADTRRCLGRSRGGLTTKLHAAVNGHGVLPRLLVTPGQRGDAPQAAALLEGLRARHVLADAAYDSDAIRGQVRTMKASACIKPNPTRTRTKRYDRHRYKHRNVIERVFRRIKQCRRVATRYEKKAANFEGFVWLAAGITMPRECP